MGWTKKQHGRRRRVLAMVVVIGGLLATSANEPAAAQVAATDLQWDLSFGSGGQVTTPNGPTAPVVDPVTGRIIAVDPTGSIRLFNADGSLRPGFPLTSPGGLAPVAGFFRPGAVCVTFGRFINVPQPWQVQCWNDTGNPTGPPTDFADPYPRPIPGTSSFLQNTGSNPVRLVRRLDNGSPDATFGTGGIVEVPAPEPTTSPREPVVALDDSGRILIVGPTSFTVQRLHPNGSPDLSFGTAGGIARFGPIDYAPYRGQLGEGYLFETVRFGVRSLQRVKFDGTLDASFGPLTLPDPVQYRPDGTGPLTSASFGYSSVLIGTDSLIYVLGSVYNAGTVLDTDAVRYTSTGQRDSSFGDNGVVTIRSNGLPGTANVGFRSVTATPGNSFVFVASGTIGSNPNVVRRVVIPPGCPTLPGTTGSGRRQLDTRIGVGRVRGVVGSDCSLTVPIVDPSGAAIPAGSSVILNLTATQPTAAGYITAWPTGNPRPNASNLNFISGQTIPNAAIIKLGTNNSIDLYNNTGTTHLLADVNGILPPTRYQGLNPLRLLDTRSGLGTTGASSIGPGQTITLQVVGPGTGAPTTAAAVALNMTVTQPTATSFLTVWPTGEPTPNASNLNMNAGTTIANLVIVKPGTNGSINIRNDSGITQVIADLNGYFLSGAATTFSPQRILDTRNGIGAPTGSVGPQTITVKVTGTTQIPTGSTGSVVLNITATQPTTTSYLTAWPAGTFAPNSSNLNYVSGQTIANLVVVPIGADGNVYLGNAAGNVHLIADISAYLP